MKLVFALTALFASFALAFTDPRKVNSNSLYTICNEADEFDCLSDERGGIFRSQLKDRNNPTSDFTFKFPQGDLSKGSTINNQAQGSSLLEAVSVKGGSSSPRTNGGTNPARPLKAFLNDKAPGKTIIIKFDDSTVLKPNSRDDADLMLAAGDAFWVVNEVNKPGSRREHARDFARA